MRPESSSSGGGGGSGGGLEIESSSSANASAASTSLSSSPSPSGKRNRDLEDEVKILKCGEEIPKNDTQHRVAATTNEVEALEMVISSGVLWGIGDVAAHFSLCQNLTRLRPEWELVQQVLLFVAKNKQLGGYGNMVSKLMHAAQYDIYGGGASALKHVEAYLLLKVQAYLLLKVQAYLLLASQLTSVSRNLLGSS
ncbi:hypothetical protein C1H46_005842 [Malus baccata]|uniref:Uncharacterized protein n=1 Tax=Malus baccata TaxID=106549 RepID=A0A540NBX1_MALBA|nr:hypothetical protein C1H46_005842 [Malus baccata]